MSLGKSIYELYHRKPFHPFRVLLKDGRSYDVQRHWNNVVGVNLIALGIPRPDDLDPFPIAQHSVEIAVDEIDRIELLTESPVPGGAR